MTPRLSGLRARVGALLLVGSLALVGPACARDSSKPREQALDTRLETHAVLPGKPTAEGLTYVQAIAKAHQAADEIAEPKQRLDSLLAALELQAPAADGTAELLRYELLARTAELMLELGEAERALALLEPQLGTATSLPLDRAAARCLVALGDAAAQTGDHVLAMGTYARSLEMLSLLLEEVEP